jgi:uncharacterized membrane protein YuzA (DUF378 family)
MKNTTEELDRKANFMVYLHILVVVLLVIGGLNWGSVGAFDYDFVRAIFKSYSKYIFMLVGVAALYFGLSRDSYLSFLGWFALPESVLIPFQPKGANLKVKVKAMEGATKVVYWATNPGQATNKVNTPEIAYNSTQNTGVVQVINGEAILSFKCPQEYKVILGLKTIKKHVHYRCVLPNGWVSSVKSVFVEC